MFLAGGLSEEIVLTIVRQVVGWSWNTLRGTSEEITEAEDAETWSGRKGKRVTGPKHASGPTCGFMLRFSRIGGHRTRTSCVALQVSTPECTLRTRPGF